LETTNSEKKSKKLKIKSASKWEGIVGYSRVVRSGNIIEVAGTTAVDDDGNIVGVGDPFAQTIFIFEKIAKYLKQAGATMEDIVRTRMYVTDISCWEEIGRAHAEYFINIKPAASMLEVSRLIDPELLIEIEVSAIIG